MDKDYIVKVLELFGHQKAGGVTEVRILPKDRYISINGKRIYVGRIVSGYYNDYDKLAVDVQPFDGKGNIYITINPCRPELLARAVNRLQLDARVTTCDDDTLSDLWFVYDTDPIRPAEISSTKEELNLALAKRDQIAEYLSRWACVVKGMSGNGGHGLIRLPGYPNNQKTRQAKERLTQFLSERFSDWQRNGNGNPVSDRRGNRILRINGVSVDSTVFNMSRIWKLYGTIACKGDSIPERPHRRSYLEIQDVKPVDLYAHLDDIIPAKYERRQHVTPQKANVQIKANIRLGNNNYPRLDVPAYLDAWGGEWRVKKKGIVTWYQFRTCPLHTDHDNDQWECGICQFPDGKMGAKCMHDPSFGWQDFKVVLGDPMEFLLS